MLSGFEEQTEPLTEYEHKQLSPLMLVGLKTKIGVENAITNKTMEVALKSRGLQINAARIRKLINHIRVYQLIPCLMASSKGYYISNDPEELKQYADSLAGREEAIRRVRLNILIQRRTLLEGGNKAA